MTNKTTKNINGNYNFANGDWTFTNNYEVIAKGNGFRDFCTAEEKIKATAGKNVKIKIRY